MNRKETTAFLSNLLINERLSAFGKHYASEVTMDYGSAHPKRVDFMLFEPTNSYSIQGIEHGIFTCYEVKSCKADVYSGNGLNFVGDKNYIVTTMQCWKDLRDDLYSGKLEDHITECNDGKTAQWGVMVPIPFVPPYNLNKIACNEYENPTPLTEEARWQLYIINQCRNHSYRTRSTVELLFCMLRSGR